MTGECVDFSFGVDGKSTRLGRFACRSASVSTTRSMPTTSRHAWGSGTPPGCRQRAQCRRQVDTPGAVAHRRAPGTGSGPTRARERAASWSCRVGRAIRTRVATTGAFGRASVSRIVVVSTGARYPHPSRHDQRANRRWCPCAPGPRLARAVWRRPASADGGVSNFPLRTEGYSTHPARGTCPAPDHLPHRRRSQAVAASPSMSHTPPSPSATRLRAGGDGRVGGLRMVVAPKV
jgi:hypothetical protein